MESHNFFGGGKYERTECFMKSVEFLVHGAPNNTKKMRKAGGKIFANGRPETQEQIQTHNKNSPEKRKIENPNKSKQLF